MIIRDVFYNITSVDYSVHFKNENRPMKRITIDFEYFSCIKLIVIAKSYWKYGHNISTYYKIKMWKIEKFCCNCKFREIYTWNIPCNNCFSKKPLYSKWKPRGIN